MKPSFIAENFTLKMKRIKKNNTPKAKNLEAFERIESMKRFFVASSSNKVNK